MDVETTPLLSSRRQLLSNNGNTVNKNNVDVNVNGSGNGRGNGNIQVQEQEVVLVDFTPFDPTNPVHFPNGYKNAMVTLLALMAFTVTFTCIGVVPVASQVVADLSPLPDNHKGGRNKEADKSASVLLVTIWELGEAAGPLLIAPLSEIYGRYAVVNVANVGFIIATAAAAACPPNVQLFIALRALTGFTVMSNVLNPAVVGDLFQSEQRGKAMSFLSLAPLIGGAIGPLIAGAVTERFSWRAVLCASTFLASACELLFLTCFRETYGPAILRRKADLLRKQQYQAQLDASASASASNTNGRQLIIRTPFDDPDDENDLDNSNQDKLSTGNGRGSDGGGSSSSSSSSSRQNRRRRPIDKLINSLLRPGVIFFSSPVLMAISLFGAVAFTYFYIMSTTLPDIVRENYGPSASLVGAVFLAFSVGSVISVAVCNLSLDRIYVFLKNKKNKKNARTGQAGQDVGAGAGAGEAEYRLPLLIVGALTLPTVVAMYGWAAEAKVSLLAFEAVLVALGAALLFAFMPLMAYVVDATGVYSASAMTAVIVTRCLMGTFLPLAVTPLIARFGYGLGLTLVASVLLVLTPIPIAIYFFGREWRQRSPYTRTD